MPFTNGVYAPPSNSVSPAVAGTTIDPSDFNDLIDDFETVFNTFWVPGDQTATAGSAMGVTHLLESNSVHTARQEGGIWSGRVSTYAAISKAFNSSTPNDSGSPCATLFAYAVNNGAAGDVCAVVADSAAFANSTTVFGFNFIARAQTGLTGVKIVGGEIDVEPASGVTPAAGSLGLAINIFNSACPGPGIQLGTVGGGTFNNGIVLDGIASAGAGLVPQSGSSMNALINTGTCTYGGDAVILSNTHKLRFSGASSTHTKLYGDASSNLRVVMSGLVAFRDSTDAANLAQVTAAGAFLVSDGTQSLPSISFLSDPDSGMFSPGANIIGWATGGTIRVALQSTNFYPFTNDGVALGGASNSWADLFLASGGVINWNNGDVLLTHSSNTLAFSGASSGYTFDASMSGTTALLSGGSADAVSLTVRQTSAGTPGSNIFSVQNNGATVNYLTVDNNGALLGNSKASSDFTTVFNCSTAGFAVQFIFRDGGANEWFMRKNTSNDFDILDSSGNTGLYLKQGPTLGFGVTAISSAWTKIAAGTTAKSQINFASSTAPTSPNDGDFWYDGTNVKIRVGGTTKTFTIT